MVINLSRSDLLGTELKHQLHNGVDVHLLKPFVSSDPGGDDITHLLQHEGGQGWSPLHGRPHLVHLALLFGGLESLLFSFIHCNNMHLDKPGTNPTSLGEISIFGNWHLEHLRVETKETSAWLWGIARARLNSAVVMSYNGYEQYNEDLTQHHYDLPQHHGKHHRRTCKSY